MGLGWAAEPTSGAAMPIFMAGRCPALKNAVETMIGREVIDPPPSE
jgi:hypothetical protein